MALVVAIAGMILPAISGVDQSLVKETIRMWDLRLMSNFECVGMPKIIERRFEVDATKSRVSSSSLSKVKIGGASPLDIVA